MFKQEDYLVFDKVTHENFKIVSVYMNTDNDTDVTVVDNIGVSTKRKLNDLHVYEKVFELCGDTKGNTFNTYTWDVVKHNRTEKMYLIMEKNVVIELDEDFQGHGYLNEKELSWLEGVFSNEIFTRMGNMYDVEFDKYVKETREQHRLEKWSNEIKVGSIIHTSIKWHNGDSVYRLMLVRKEVDIDESEFYLVNLEHGNVLPTFVGKEETEAIDFVVNVLKQKVLKVENI